MCTKKQKVYTSIFITTWIVQSQCQSTAGWIILSEFLATVIGQENKFKGIQIRKGTNKTIIVDDMIFYIENHEDEKKVLENKWIH